MLKNKLAIFILMTLMMFFAAPAMAQDALLDVEGAGKLQAQDEAFIKASGLTNSGPGSILALVIQSALGMIGVIFVIMIISAGFRWLTSSGNEESITKAKKTLTASIVGLIVVLSAYVITVFTLDAALTATKIEQTSTNIF